MGEEFEIGDFIFEKEGGGLRTARPTLGGVMQL
jgi:hypothetical protein